MLQGLPLYISIAFILTVVLTLVLFIRAANYNKKTILISLCWLLITGVLAYCGFLKNTNPIPPRFFFVMLPVVIFIAILFISKKGQAFIDQLDLKNLTTLHVVRIPVEIVLYWLALNKAVPNLMTFTGNNFDILAGITAPIVGFVCFKGAYLKNKKILLVWNFICLALLFNIIFLAVLSAPFSFQQFAFNQPNIAVLYFPFIWLPAFIVAIVMFSHFASIRQLMKLK
jgi:hypothetical protein